MPHEPQSLILAYLRRLDEKFDRLAIAAADLNQRITSAEDCVEAMHRDVTARFRRMDEIERQVREAERA